MRTYQRLMRRNEVTYEVPEQDKLSEDLASAPGINDFKIVKKHPKGGYRVALDVSDDCLDVFISHLEARNWMSVF